MGKDFVQVSLPLKLVKLVDKLKLNSSEPRWKVISRMFTYYNYDKNKGKIVKAINFHAKEIIKLVEKQ